jgi:ABC-2 type transport system permease protein
MLVKIARFELRNRLRLLSTWVYFLVFFALAFFAMIISGGAFDSLSVAFESGGKVQANAPYAILQLISQLGFFGILVIAAVMGQSVHQDVASGIHPLIYTAPIRKGTYLMGRFAAATAALAIIFSSLPLGLWAGASMPFLNADTLAANVQWHYWQPFLVSTVANIVSLGVIFFALSALARRIAAVHVGAVLLLVAYISAGSMLHEIENKYLVALLDPFGIYAIQQATEYWTISEKNHSLMPLSGVFLHNRLLWLAIGAAIFALTTLRFRFMHHGAAEKRSGKSAASAPPAVMPEVHPITRGIFGHLALLPGLAWLELRQILFSRSFVIIALAGIAMVINAGRMVGSVYGTDTYPVTYEVVEMASGLFSLFLLVILILYSGEAVWREREARIDQLNDVLPTPSWLPYAGKLLALMAMEATLLVVLMITCIGIQAWKGYFNFDLGQYVVTLFALKWPTLCLSCVLAVLVQVISPSKYLGHFLMVLYYVYVLFNGKLGFEHNLWTYGAKPGFMYSDMNGFGHFMAGIAWFDCYWAFWAVVMAVVTRLLWPRGVDSGVRMRIRLARTRFGRAVVGTLVLAGLAIIGLGAVIIVNTTRINRYRTSWDGEQQTVRFEKEYKHFETMPHPRITSVQVAIDLFPDERRFRAHGTYQLRNKRDEPVRTVLVAVPWKAQIAVLTIDGVQPARSDGELGLHIIELPEAISVGGEATLTFDLTFHWRGFTNEIEISPIVGNGTFIHSTWLPWLGYSRDAELDDENMRKKHGLPPKERMAAVDDVAARMNTYISNDADWIDFEATISTNADQMAIAPGDLEREWSDGGRRFFRYRAKNIVNFYSFLSARYETAHDRWNDVSLTVYHQRGHEYNVQRMLDGMKAALSYCTGAFSPYPYRHMRVVEFPRYVGFAQSFPNTIPFSESIGFIAKVDETDAKGFDYPFYVTAHEVAHQWWGHQAIGGNVQGCTMLSETLAQYTALMVAKKTLGEAKIGRFLHYELDRYLVGRSFERRKELPLVRVEAQEYIHYRKGSLAMYLLQDVIGEDRVNRALAAWLKEVAHQEPPYTNSLALIAHLRAETPPEFSYLIEDLFETITLYENRAVRATCVEKDGRYEVTMTIVTKKLRASELGDEREVAMDDLIPIGAVDADGSMIAMEKRRLGPGENTVSFTADKMPAKVGVDPIFELVDRKPDDNMVAVTLEKP